LHYFAKRFFAPVMVSCCETGEMTERPSCVSQPAPIRKAARFSVANETSEDVPGKVIWALRDPKANIISSGELKIVAGAYSSAWMDEIDFSGCDELSN
jgi:beta-mannosidase